MTKYPWHNHYPHDVSPQFAGISAPLTALFDGAVNAHRERVALDFLGATTTYDALGRKVQQLAAALQQMGVGAGTKVGLCLPNCPQYVISYFAILKTGATVVNYNPLYTADELAQQIADSSTSIMITMNLAQIYPKVRAALGHTPLQKVIVTKLSSALPILKAALFPILKRKELVAIPQDHHHHHFDELLQAKNTFSPIDIDPATDLAVLQYTGGTTGVPKGAMLTHRNLYSNAVQVRQWLGEPDPAGERFLAVLPFFHVFAMTGLLNLGLSVGARIVMLPKFELNQFISTLKSTKPTLLAGVPTLFNAMIQHAKLSKQDFASLRYCISGGAGLPGDIKRRFEQKTAKKLLEGYGLTECSPVAACSPRHTGGKAGSVGLPLPGSIAEIRDIADPAKVLGSGEIGEVYLSGPQVMVGYWQAPEATAEVLNAGWLRTGDMGYLDGDGYLFLTDRLKEIILSNGYNIYPSVIERALHRHPDVLEAAVVAEPHPEKGEVPRAYVVLKEGTGISAEELKSYCHQELNPLERPNSIILRDELPKTMVGKLDKKPLKAETEQEHSNKEVPA